MKKIVFLLILINGFLNVYAQNSGISVTLGYPLPVGDNFVSETTGIIDAGVQIRLLKDAPVNVGLSGTIGFVQASSELGSVTIKDRANYIIPRVFGELNLDALSNFKPFAGIGYTFFNAKATYEGVSQPPVENKENGLNLNIGVAYNFSESWFLHVQYDHTKLDREGPFLDEGYATTIAILKLGMGYRF